MSQSSEEIVYGRILPPEFGDGWMTDNACDFFRILVFAGFPFKDLFVMVNRLQRDHSRKINTATVEHAAEILSDKYTRN